MIARPSTIRRSLLLLLFGLSGIGEVYREGYADPALQATLRTVLLPDRIEMDMSVTRAGPFADRRTRATVGLTFMFAPLY